MRLGELVWMRRVDTVRCCGGGECGGRCGEGCGGGVVEAIVGNVGVRGGECEMNLLITKEMSKGKDE